MEQEDQLYAGSKRIMQIYGVTMPTLRKWMKLGLPRYKTPGGPRGHLLFDLQEVDLWVRGNFERFPKEK